MRFRHIMKADNKKIVVNIRKVIIEMGAPKVGNANEDAELEAMFEAYQNNRFIYFVVENRNKILGGKGIAPIKNGHPLISEFQEMYFIPGVREKYLEKHMIQICDDFNKASNFTQCYIETTSNIQFAQKSYIKTGFKYIDYSMGNTGNSSFLVWMLRTL